jgi:ABC-type enterobactin transport system permease subunit
VRGSLVQPVLVFPAFQKVTVPAPSVGLTTAVKVMLCPYPAGFWEEERTVVVGVLFTVWVTVPAELRKRCRRCWWR